MADLVITAIVCDPALIRAYRKSQRNSIQGEAFIPEAAKVTVHTKTETHTRRTACSTWTTKIKQEAFEKCWAHSPLRAAARRLF